MFLENILALGRGVRELRVDSAQRCILADDRVDQGLDIHHKRNVNGFKQLAIVGVSKAAVGAWIHGTGT